LTVELFGEQTVQVITAVLQAASVLLATIAVVLLSVRTVTAGRPVPARCVAPRLDCLMAMEGFDRPSDQVLRSSLPARAPPSSLLRPCPIPLPRVLPRQ